MIFSSFFKRALLDGGSMANNNDSIKFAARPCCLHFAVQRIITQLAHLQLPKSRQTKCEKNLPIRTSNNQ